MVEARLLGARACISIVDFAKLFEASAPVMQIVIYIRFPSNSFVLGSPVSDVTAWQ